jgi:hypothetical protein
MSSSVHDEAIPSPDTLRGRCRGESHRPHVVMYATVWTACVVTASHGAVLSVRPGVEGAIGAHSLRPLGVRADRALNVCSQCASTYWH